MDEHTKRAHLRRISGPLKSGLFVVHKDPNQVTELSLETFSETLRKPERSNRVPPTVPRFINQECFSGLSPRFPPRKKCEEVEFSRPPSPSPRPTPLRPLTSQEFSDLEGLFVTTFMRGFGEGPKSPKWGSLSVYEDLDTYEMIKYISITPSVYRYMTSIFMVRINSFWKQHIMYLFPLVL